MKTLINTFKQTIKAIHTPTSDKGAVLVDFVYNGDKKKKAIMACAVGAIDGAIKGAVGPIGGAAIGAYTNYHDFKMRELMVKSVCEFALTEEEIKNIQL